MLGVAAPVLVQATILASHFWPHYLQLLHPFIGIGAASLFALLRHQAHPRWLDRLWSRRWVIAPIVLLLLGPLSDLDTKPRDRAKALDHGVSSLVALLEQHGLPPSDFLTPYTMYPHIALKQRRHGFPNAVVTHALTVRGDWTEVVYPVKFPLPSSTQEYCRMLDARGPSLIVFFRGGPLVHCELQAYDFHDVSAEPGARHGVQRYFIRSRRLPDMDARDLRPA